MGKELLICPEIIDERIEREGEKINLGIFNRIKEESYDYIQQAKKDEWDKIACFATKSNADENQEMRRIVVFSRSVEIMRLLKNDSSFASAMENIKQKTWTRKLLLKTLNNVMLYCEQGPSFYEYYYGDDILDIDRQTLEDIREVNRLIGEGKTYQSALEIVLPVREVDVLVEGINRFKGVVAVNQEDNSFVGVGTCEDNQWIDGTIEDGEVSFTIHEKGKETTICQCEKYMGFVNGDCKKVETTMKPILGYTKDSIDNIRKKYKCFKDGKPYIKRKRRKSIKNSSTNKEKN